MTRRDKAINDILLKLRCDPADARHILAELIDHAEAGKLKEPLPMVCVGMNGTNVVTE